MKIFISWSGDRSRVVAKALKTWLSGICPNEQVFMSEHDIHAGLRWESSLNSELESSNFGIICLTPENLNAAWLLFESGALSKTITVARVVPYRFELNATDVLQPLAQFQGVNADADGTFKLLESINAAREERLPVDQLKRNFRVWWPEMETDLKEIPPSSSRMAIEGEYRTNDSRQYRVD